MFDPADPTVDAPAVRPVSFDSDPAEALLFDESTAQTRTPLVVLVGAVRCFADRDEAAAPRTGEDGLEIIRCPQRPRQSADFIE